MDAVLTRRPADIPFEVSGTRYACEMNVSMILTAIPLPRIVHLIYLRDDRPNPKISFFVPLEVAALKKSIPSSVTIQPNPRTT
jgi:hypothetical protein